MLAELAVFFDRQAKPEIAATIYGTSRHYINNPRWAHWARASLSIALANLRGVLGDTKFDQYVRRL